VPAKVTKLIGLRILLFLSPINLVTFAGKQNSDWNFGSKTVENGKIGKL
jgi:hypothetical protein